MGIAADGVEGHLAEGSVAVAEQHAELVAEGERDREIAVSVTVEVPDGGAVRLRA